MQIEDPSDEVVRAIEGAVAWFERSKLEGIKLVRVDDPTKPKGFDEWFSAGNWYDIGHEYIYHNGRQVPPRKGDTADVLMDLALEWIGRQAAEKKPFLAAIWFPSPHGPHLATPEDAAPYAKYGKAKANYYGELTAVDRNIGRLRKALRDMKIADDTMLWFCSDNGGAFPLSTGGLPGGKKWLTEGGTRVPGILEWPTRVPEPFITSVPACTMDFYPTVLDLLDIDITDEESEEFQRLTAWEGQWRETVKKDQAVYTVKRR